MARKKKYEMPATLFRAKPCSKCGSDDPRKVVKKKDHRHGGVVRYSLCRDCVNAKAKIRRDKNKTHIKAKTRFRRQNDVPGAIARDAKQSDRRRGLYGDIDKQFVSDLIANGCTYCGETTIRMTVDRIDNAVGHTRGNVVPACIRCNMMRRDMPYEAWLEVSKSVRSARELGLFGDWTGSIHKPAIAPEPESKRPKKKDVEHGTVYGYTHHGCRCDECRSAVKMYMRDKRAKEK